MGDKHQKANKKPNIPPSEKEPPGYFTNFLFLWMMPIFYHGNYRDIEEEDFTRPPPIYDSKVVGDKLEKKWHEEIVKAKTAGRKPSFTRALVKAFFWSYLQGGIMQFLYTVIRTGTPLLFAELLSFWSVDSTMSRQTAAYYAAGMVIATWVSIFLNHHSALFCGRYGMKLRVAIGSVMFRKIMRMNNGSLGDTAAGKVVNILSNDLQRFDLAFLFLNYVWIIPIQMAAVFYLGFRQAGYAAVIGLTALIVLVFPIQGVLGRVNGIIRSKAAAKTDDRIKVMSEVINGIQVIKMYAWEIPFQNVVKDKRNDEMQSIRAATFVRTNLIGFLVFTERVALFITVLTYVLLGNAMSANIIYPLIQFIAAAQINVTLILPLILTFTAELIVSLKRIQQFMDLEDRPDLSAITMESSSDKLFRNMNRSFRNEKEVVPHGKASSIGITKRKRSMSYPGDVAVELRDVSASWTGDPYMLALNKISVRIRKGKLCAIIGAVGSGKSSFLQLLLKELTEASGSVSIYGDLSYACQEAWLFPSTVRENILFGLPYEPEKYNKVCKVCALEKDFSQFPYGDQTIVGERGVSLSGGQRARINLARSVYRQANIYLLDDPLSAVDANVGRQLFEGCINGFLRGQTRILVTHQIHFLKAADYIIVMNNGSIENMGTFDELASSGKDFSLLLTALEESKDTDSTGSGVSLEKDKRPNLQKSISVVSKQESEDLPQFEEQKIAAEERQSGSLKWNVFSGYFLAGGNLCFIIFVLFMILIAASSAAAIDYWVSYWTNEMVRYEESLEGAELDPSLSTQVGLFTTQQYITIMGAMVGICISLTLFRNIPFVSLCMAASNNLHNNMFSTMLRGVMRFFDTSSSGRILNRFTKDMGAIDEILPRSLLDVLQIYSTLAAILILNAIALYWTLVPSAFLLILFFYSVRIYLKTAQGVKRLEGTTKSPVFGMVTSSLNGIATIRSAGAQDRLVQDFDRHQDLHTCAWNSYLGGGSTYGFYLDTLCLVYLTVIIYVFLYLDFGGAIAIGSVGLAVTQSNTLTMMLQHGARMLVEFIAQLTSVERVLEYTRIDTEDNLFESKMAIPPTWPMVGRIEFKNVSMRYAPDEAPILKNLNISIESGWKVGIVGRTGAGKSSLISALFRFAHIDGLILIDGVDTSLVSRQGLRSKISIIPQEPVLFSATVRYNLDPFNIYSDDEIWRALEQVDMKSAIPALDFNVTEGGANFSVGQRQLMCLARAVLRSNKILIMDEATANVDPQTDNFIQQTIRRQFASCTVLTIAHRLNTIMDSDRVLVMSSGEVAEFDHPYTLLSDPNSHLSSMVRETGEKSSAQLFQVAKDAYFQSNMKENAR